MNTSIYVNVKLFILGLKTNIRTMSPEGGYQKEFCLLFFFKVELCGVLEWSVAQQLK